MRLHDQSIGPQIQSSHHGRAFGQEDSTDRPRNCPRSKPVAFDFERYTKLASNNHCDGNGSIPAKPIFLRAAPSQSILQVSNHLWSNVYTISASQQTYLAATLMPTKLFISCLIVVAEYVDDVSRNGHIFSLSSISVFDLHSLFISHSQRRSNQFLLVLDLLVVL